MIEQQVILDTGVLVALLNRRDNYHAWASVADACLVRMSELVPNSVVMTLDSDFLIYRRYRNEEISVIQPKLF